MSERKIENGMVEGTRLGLDRGVFLCGWLTLTFNGSGQGFGGYVLGKQNSEEPAGAYAEVWLLRILEVLEVEKWEDLKGTPCRVDHDWGKVYGIGHYQKDKWFYPVEEFEKLNEEQK